MKESGNYPLGAEFDDSAPWNEKRVEDREFEVTVSETLSRYTTVSTHDYIPINYHDEDGEYTEDADTSDTNWVTAYKESNYSITDLLKELKSLCKYCLTSTQLEKVKRNKLNNIIKACEGWVEDDIDVEPN